MDVVETVMMHAFRVESPVEQFKTQIDDDDDECRDEDERLDERQIGRSHCRLHRLADARQREQHLDDDRTAEQDDELDGDARDDRQSWPPSACTYTIRVVGVPMARSVRMCS